MSPDLAVRARRLAARRSRELVLVRQGVRPPGAGRDPVPAPRAPQDGPGTPRR